MSQLVLFRLGFVPALVVLGLAFGFVPRYVQLYTASGLALPIVTTFLFDGYPLIACLPLLFVAVWYVLPRHEARGTLALGSSVLLSVFVVVFGYWAVHLPLQLLAPAP